MSPSNRTHGDVSPAASSVPPPGSSPRSAIAAGKYVLAACRDGTGRAQRGVATVFVAGVTTYVRFRRIAMAPTSRDVHTGVYELDRLDGSIRRAGASVGRWQWTAGAEPELVLVFLGVTEVWTPA